MGEFTGFVTTAECHDMRRRVRSHGVPYKRLSEDLNLDIQTVGFHVRGNCTHPDEPVPPVNDEGDRP